MKKSLKVAVILAAGAVLGAAAPAFADPDWKHGRGHEYRQGHGNGHGGDRHRRVVVIERPHYYAAPGHPVAVHRPYVVERPVIVERRVVVREPVYVARPPAHVYYAPRPPMVVHGDMGALGGAVVGAVIGGYIGGRM
jgi:hypothetical protein